MKNELRFRSLTLGIGMSLLTIGLQAQCETWIGNPNMDAITDNHSIYRGLMKGKDYAGAFVPWKKVYDAAPAADGKRDYHYRDGITIYRDMFTKENKDEYKEMVLKLYDQSIECVASGAIKMKKSTPKEYIAYQEGQRAFDLFYTFNVQDEMTYSSAKKSIDGGGNKTLYSVITPLSVMTVQMVTNEKITKEEARSVYQQIQDVCEYNIANSKKYGTYYQQALDYSNAQFESIENFLFDCDYFAAKLKPEYDNGKQEDFKFIEASIRTLKKQGCSSETPLLVELEAKWAKYAATVNAERVAEFRANNPASVAANLYKTGDYNGSINKYREALNTETNSTRNASYHYYIAKSLKKIKSFSEARKEARTSMQLDPNRAGRANLLIGELYAAGAKRCGDSFKQRLAILAAVNKFRLAKNDSDSNVSARANKLINTYGRQKPDKEKMFFLGYKPGQMVNVGCWIGESVKLPN